jgi:hypothetical protein
VNTTELTEHLRAATGGLEPPPGFADAVLRGGRRRRARRRLTVTASVLAVVAVATAATVVTLREDTPAPVADVRLTQPTKGDLAGDQAFLDEARKAWQEGLPIAPEARDRYYDDPRGEPHVYWAGNTPAGRAAIVLQPVYVHPNSQVTEKGLHTAEGLVAIDQGDGRFKLVGTHVIGQDRPGQAAYYKFGPNNRTMLIVDRGEPVHYDLDPDYDDKVRAYRFDWQRAEPDGGVAIVTVPAGKTPLSAIAYEGNDPPGQLSVDELPVVPRAASVWLPLRLPDPAYRLDSSVLAWGDVVWRLGEPVELTAAQLESLWGYYRYYPGEYDVATSLWTIAAALPDGRVVILKERQNGTAKPRLIAEVAPNPNATETVMIDGGVVDSSAILPIRFSIPDGGGWIVADKGKRLSYRTSPDEAWQDAGRDAALLPANATEVLVDDLYVRL